VTSIYNPYLLIINTKERLFGVIGIQTNDILILSTKDFKKLEKEELIKAKLLIKPKEALSQEKPLIFNNYILLQ